MNTAKAEAEMAYGLQASKEQARIKEEEMQVERQQETNIIFIRSLSKSSTKMTHFFAGKLADAVCAIFHAGCANFLPVHARTLFFADLMDE